MTEPEPHRRTTPDPEPEGTGKEFARDQTDAADLEGGVTGTPPGSGKQFAEPEQSRPKGVAADDVDRDHDREDRPPA